MTHAAITGWAEAMPPAVLSNADLATFLDTDDAWIASRTGIRERRIAHVPGVALASVAAARALACAGLAAHELEMVVYGSCSYDEQVPNCASGVQLAIGASRAAAMDINTACTSFLYGLSSASALIRAGTLRNALVVGVEVVSPYMDWSNRNVAVLFGDGCAAVVLEASEEPCGIIGDKLGCYADARDILRVRGVGARYANRDVAYGDTEWDFDGAEIYRRAVAGMGEAAAEALARSGHVAADIDLAVPHQANLRIIEAVAKKTGIAMDRVHLTIERYGNMSAATVPVALTDALAAARVKPHALLLTPAFGGGLTWCAQVIRWGERVTPKDVSDVALPPCTRSALEIVDGYRRIKADRMRSAAGLSASR